MGRKTKIAGTDKSKNKDLYICFGARKCMRMKKERHCLCGTVPFFISRYSKKYLFDLVQITRFTA